MVYESTLEHLKQDMKVNNMEFVTHDSVQFVREIITQLSEDLRLNGDTRLAQHLDVVSGKRCTIERVAMDVEEKLALNGCIL